MFAENPLAWDGRPQRPPLRPAPSESALIGIARHCNWGVAPMAHAFVNGRLFPLFAQSRAGMEGKAMWNAVRNESREFIWLASMVSGLSLLGVGLAVALALVLVGVP